MKNNFDNVRRINFPFYYVSTVENDASPQTFAGLVSNIQCTINSITVLPSKIYNIKNFAYELNYFLVSASQATTSPPDFNFQSPNLYIAGLSSNQNANYLVNQYPSLNYRYNSILNNPNLSINSTDINTRINPLNLFSAPSRPDNLFSVLSTDNSNTIFPAPSSFKNIISVKSLGNFVANTYGSSGGIQSSKDFRYFRFVSTDDFIFQNYNYSSMLFYFNPPQLIKNDTGIGQASLYLNLSGNISFDLEQYSA